MSIGDLISGSGGTLSQMAAMGQGGTAAGPGGPGGAQVAFPQSGTPSQAQQSPPDLAQLYMKLYQQDRQADTIDKGLAGVASAFAAPGTQRDVYNSLAPNSQRDPAAMLGNIVQLEQMQQQMRNRPAMVANATGDGSGGGGGLPAAVANSMSNEELIKNAQARAQAQSASNIAIAQQKAEGVNKDVQDFKNSGIQDFSAADQKLKDSQAGVDQLLNNMPDTMKALSAPDFLTTNKAASWLPFGYSDAVKQQAIAIQKLEAGLTGESLQSVKNVRNQREFSTLGEALTAGLNVNNGPQGVQDALNAIRQKMSTAHANVYATAGKEIPNQFAGMADPSYTSPTINGASNPYFTGSTYEKPPSTERYTASTPAAAAPLPSGAVDMLMKNPALAPQFDAKYGAGASDRILRAR